MDRTSTVIETDGALILGAGIAGLFTALKLAPFPALVLAGSRPGTSGSSAWAQGGIAAAGGEGDAWRSHAADTMAAGAGLCDPQIVDLVAREAPDRIADLVAMGTPFDRDASGALALGREAAHSRARIVHVTGDRADAEISRTLAARVLATPSIKVMEGFHAVELAMEDGHVAGLFARHGQGADARLVLFRARAVIFATGGLGALYAVTTNPPESRGEGLGRAARAGGGVARRRGDRRSGIRPVPSDGACDGPRSGRARDRSAAWRRRAARRRARHALHAFRAQGCRAGAARYRGARDLFRDCGGPQSLPRLPRSHRRPISRALPNRLGRLSRRRFRSGARAD